MYQDKIKEIKNTNMELEKEKRRIIEIIADIEREQLVNQGKIDILEEIQLESINKDN